MLTGTDQVQILALNLVHHAFHFSKGHYAGYHIAADHKRRNVVGKALVDHKVTGICQNGGVQPCNIAAQIVEAVAAGVSGCINVDAVELFHNIHVIRHLKIRNNRLAEALYFHIFRVILADGHRIVNKVRDYQHNLPDFLRKLGFLLFQCVQLIADCADLCLYSLSLILFALSHKCADLLADGLPLAAKLVTLNLGFPELLVQFYDFVYQRQLFVLEFLPDIFLDFFRIIPDPFHINHDSFPSFSMLCGKIPQNLPCFCFT